MCDRDDDPTQHDVPRRVDAIHDALATGSGCRHRFTLTPECERVAAALAKDENGLCPCGHPVDDHVRYCPGTPDEPNCGCEQR